MPEAINNYFDNDIDDDIIDPTEDYSFRSGSEKAFSHESLVMRAYQKVQDALAVEMVEGHSEVIKSPNGKSVLIYHEDTRFKAIECIKTLKNTMIANLNNNAFGKEIERLLKDLEEKLKFYVNKQRAWFSSLKQEEQQAYYNKYPEIYEYISAGMLHSGLMFSNIYIEKEVDIYRRIFEQMELCLAEIKYFKKGRIGERLPSGAVISV